MFWVNLGISGNFGKEKPCAEEDQKGWYKPNKKGFWRLIWEGRPIADTQELIELSLSLQNLFYISFSKTSYFPMQI